MTSTDSLPEYWRYRAVRSATCVPTPARIVAANTDWLPWRGTAAGGGYSTVGDFARFADALMSHRLLSADSTELLITGKVALAPGSVRLRIRGPSRQER